LLIFVCVNQWGAGQYLKPGDDWECGCAYRPVISLEKENPNEKLGILGKIMRLFSKRGS
jgi:hypothetical protein